MFKKTPTIRILNLLSIGGECMKILAKVIMWLIGKILKKEQPHIEVVNLINVQINIHKD